MFKILKSYGIPDKITEAIRCIYNNSTSQVKIENELSEPIKITTGVMQRDALAPVLFTIVMDYLIKKASINQGIITHQNPLTKLTYLAYADDLALFCENPEKALEYLNNIEREARKVGLKINFDKTKFITNIQEEQQLTRLKEKIQKVCDFVYLGAHIKSAIVDFKSRKGKAWGTYGISKKFGMTP